MILAADVDDTICSSTQPVAAPMADQLRRLYGLGWKLLFLSGSTVAQIREQLGPRLGVPHWLLGATGTHALEYRGGQEAELYRLELPAATRAQVVRSLQALVLRHGLRPVTSTEDQIQDRGSQVTLSVLGRHAPEAEKRAFDPEGKRRRAWIEELKKELPGELSIHVGGTTSIDVTARAVDKGWGLTHFLKHRSLEREGVLYLGDQLEEGGNDFPVRPFARCVQVASLEQTLDHLRAIQDPGPWPDLPYLETDSKA